MLGWARHRRTDRELGPLWHALHELFPDGTLPSRLPSSGVLKAATPWHARRRAVRRQLEIRDGLVRISPHLDLTGAAGNDTALLAERLVAAVTRYRTPLALSQPFPVAIPASPGLDTDAAELAHLSRQVKAALSRRQYLEEERI
jgi:hypothetical protein